MAPNFLLTFFGFVVGALAFWTMGVELLSYKFLSGRLHKLSTLCSAYGVVASATIMVYLGADGSIWHYRDQWIAQALAFLGASLLSSSLFKAYFLSQVSSEALSQYNELFRQLCQSLLPLLSMPMGTELEGCKLFNEQRRCLVWTTLGQRWHVYPYDGFMHASHHKRVCGRANIQEAVESEADRLRTLLKMARGIDTSKWRQS